VRLGVDLQLLPADIRPAIDRLFIECQPGHVQYSAKRPIESADRDVFRAGMLRSEFEKVARPAFSASQDKNPNASS
jgi:protein arginine kinase